MSRNLEKHLLRPINSHHMSTFKEVIQKTQRKREVQHPYMCLFEELTYDDKSFLCCNYYTIRERVSATHPDDTLSSL